MSCYLVRAAITACSMIRVNVHGHFDGQGELLRRPKLEFKTTPVRKSFPITWVRKATVVTHHYETNHGPCILYYKLLWQHAEHFMPLFPQHVTLRPPTSLQTPTLEVLANACTRLDLSLPSSTCNSTLTWKPVLQEKSKWPLDVTYAGKPSMTHLHFWASHVLQSFMSASSVGFALWIILSAVSYSITFLVNNSFC